MLRLLLFFCACILSLNAQAQSPFVVTGEIKGLKPTAKIYINFVNGDTRELDSANVVDGKFVIKGKAVLPTTAQLRLKHNDLPVSPDPKLRSRMDILQIYLDEQEVIITSNDSLKNAVFQNSLINQKFKELETILKPIRERSSVLAARKFSADTTLKYNLEKDEEALEKERVVTYLKFAALNTDNYIGLQAFSYAITGLFEPADVQPLFEQFPSKFKESDLGKQVQARIDRAQKTALGIITDFEQQDRKGRMVKLSDFRGSYVLVDFWASWCIPCREENPNIVKAYEKFKNQKFHIIGVSLDSKDGKKQWLEAIKDDRLSWTQLSDLQFWNNAVAKQYAFENIPFNFLVDPEGRIIAKQLTGASLMEKLYEIFPSNP